jgi:hypothetical protein
VRAVLSVAECLAQGGNVKAQTAFFHHLLRPDPSQQVPLADGFAGPGRKREKDIERTRAQFDMGAVLLEKPFTCD